MTSSAFGRLGRASVIYGLGTVISRAASFIMLPVYTRLLTPSDYGILQMLDMTLDVVAILLSAGATAGVMRFYYKAETDSDKKTVLGSAVVLLVSLNLLGTVGMVATAPAIVRHLLESTGTEAMVIVAAANFTIGSIGTVPMLMLQMQERAVLYTALNVGRLLVQLTLNIVLLVVFDMGPMGILVSNLTSSVLLGTITMGIFLRECGLHVSWEATRSLKSFAVPYQITTAGAFILTFGNRYFIQLYGSLAEVGIFGLAFQFGFLLASLTYGPIAKAWTPQRHEEAKLPRAERDRLYNDGMLLLSGVTISGALGISLFSRPVLMVMSDASFHGAAAIVPLVVLAYIMQAWSDSFMFNFDVGERPSCITIGTWITVGVAMGLFVTLIPLWGMVGAALATVIAFALRLAIYWVWSQRVWPVSVEWRPNAGLLAAAGVCYLGYYLVAPDSLIYQLLLATACFSVYATVSWLVLPDPVRTSVAQLASPVLRRLRVRASG